MQCKQFLFIFPFKNKTHYQSILSKRKHGAHHVRMHLQRHYRSRNQRNHRRRGKYDERFAGSIGGRYLLWMLRRIGCFILECQQCPDYHYLRHQCPILISSRIPKGRLKPKSLASDGLLHLLQNNTTYATIGLKLFGYTLQSQFPFTIKSPL